LFEATSCDHYFSDYSSESAKVWKSQFQCSITSLLLVLEQKIALPGYRKSYPSNPEMF
jgi:hypothetical protein